MLRRRFRAMGTDVELLLNAEHGPQAELALDAAEQEVRRLEELLSRFRPDSELSRLNAGGRLDGAHRDLVQVVELALAARVATGGLFDPTVHDALVAAGYDRTFEDVPGDGPPAGPARPCAGGVTVEGSTIALEPGTRIDLGGIAKGYAADRACELLATAGPCLVNAGGDIAVGGGAWPIGVTDDLTLELSAGGLATSGRDRRTWRRGGEGQHHLIDPRTGRPAHSAAARVTVVGKSATQAEVLAKVAFLGGAVDAPHVVVDDNGQGVLAGGLA